MYLHFTSKYIINSTVKLMQLVPLRFMLIAFITKREKKLAFLKGKKGGDLKAIVVNDMEMTETLSSPF